MIHAALCEKILRVLSRHSRAFVLDIRNPFCQIATMNIGFFKNSLLAIITAIVFPFAACGTATDDLLAKLDPNGLVNDYARVIAPADLLRISNLVAEVRQKTMAAIAVVTVKSMDGGNVDDFTGKLFAKWALGEKGRDNGVMVLASIDDRKIRIEVGYGLEGAINDAKAGRIMDEQMVPAFKEGRYGDGLYNAAAALAALIAIENKVALTNIATDGLAISNALAAAGSPSVPPSNLIGGFITLGIFICLVVIVIILAKKGKKAGHWRGSSGGASGGLSSPGGSGSAGNGGFGGGRSGGGGASRGW